MNIPNQANIVIIGGGIAGCSIAYHLTKLGVRDVVLLERRQLTCGTTWHAAGLVGQLRATRNLTELAQYTAELYRSLEAETGQATGFRQNGSVTVAKSAARFEELKRGVSMGRMFGLEMDLLTPGEIKERWPLLKTDDLVGGIFIPKDGQTNPIDTAQALAKGAKQRGARIFEHTKVERIRVERGRAVGVDTESGFLRADTVILAGGMWSRELAAAAGVAVPLHAAEHFYIVTEPIAGLPAGLPVLRVQDECAYYKEDAGKLLMGCFEPIAKPWGMQGIPEDFCFDTLPEDPDHFEPILNAAVNRVPVLGQAGIALFFNGPESFTPDDRYYVGETPEVRDTVRRDGINSVGIAASGGVGKTDRVKDKDGNWQDRTEWRNLVAFQRTAEIAGEYLKKGRTVYIEGRIRTDSWDDKDTGQKKYKTEIIVNDLVLLGGRARAEPKAVRAGDGAGKIELRPAHTRARAVTGYGWRGDH